jgi:class 3 adenylate cyclase/TolB-like protein
MPAENRPHIDTETKLAAIMFTDIAGYTKMMGLDEEKGLELIRKNREIHKPLIKKYKGKWIKEMGDGMLAQFDSAYNAARCAIEIQQRAKKELNGKLRIGLHTGEVIIENEDIFGDGVNVASRIESIAEPGSIYFSDAFFRALKNRKDIQSKYLGEVSLKNVEEPVKIYCVASKDLAVPSQEKIKQLRKGLKEKKLTFHRFFKQPLFYILIILLLVGLFTIQNLSVVKKSRTVEAIAVLPFANFTGREDEQYFVDMMQDAVISEISKIGDIIVKSRTSTLQFRNSNLTIPEIAKILDVDAIIESSIYKTGDSIYMQVQLIRARPVEDHIWAQDYERDTRYILSLYGDLARQVAEEIEVQLTPEQKRRFMDKEEVNTEAYKAYFKGQYHWYKLSKEGLDSAEYYFKISKELDPNYALAYAGLASVAMVRAQNGLIPYHEAAIEHIGYLNKAQTLDSTLSEIHFLVAGFSAWGIWDFEKAENEFKKALKLNPNHALLRVYYAHLLCYFHNYNEAILQGKYALRLDPYNNLIKGIYGMALNNCRKYEMADSIFNVVLENEPYDAISLSNLKTTYHMQKKYDKAYKLWKDDFRNDPPALTELESGYEIGGYPLALENLADLMVERSKTEFITPWRIATLYTRAGVKDKAIEYLDKAFYVHDQNMPYLASDPIFDFMRDDLKFQVIIKKMNFPEKS